MQCSGEELLDRLPAELSGGQQQCVAPAPVVVLVKEQRRLLLKEPLANLDATSRLIMRAEIHRLRRRLGVITIFVSSDQIEATTMANRLVCLSKGRIQQVGTADDLYQRPNQLFIGAPPINFLDGQADCGAVRVDALTLRAGGLGFAGRGLEAA